MINNIWKTPNLKKNIEKVEKIDFIIANNNSETIRNFFLEICLLIHNKPHLIFGVGFEFLII